MRINGVKVIFLAFAVLSIIFTLYINPTILVRAEVNNTTTSQIEHLWIKDLQWNALVTNPNHDALYFGGDNGLLGIYNRTSNTTEDLRNVDLDDWTGTLRIDAMDYDTDNNLLYFGGGTGAGITMFGVYNRTSNVSEDLTTTDVDDWMGDVGFVTAIAVDSARNVVYIGGYNGMFGIYNRSTNITHELKSTDTADWIADAEITDLAMDSGRNSVYIGSVSGAAPIFGMYNRTTNISNELRTTDLDNWMGNDGIYSMTFDNVKNLTYVGLNGGEFGAYNRTSNATEDLSTTDTGNWIGSSAIYAIASDAGKNAVYLATADSFGIYNRTTNITDDLGGTDTDDWTNGWGLTDIDVNPITHLVYFGGIGRFGAYNRTSNVTSDLNGPNDWVRFNTLVSLDFDALSLSIYLGGYSGIFGFYNITSDTKEDLRLTDIDGWVGATRIQNVDVDPVQNLTYFVGLTGLFGVYNKSDNSTYPLNGTDPNNWMGTQDLYGVAADSEHNVVYIVGNTGVFGIYNRTTNVTDMLNSTDVDNWTGTTNLWDAAYNSNNDLVYIGGVGLLGVYNRSSNKTVTLNETGIFIEELPITGLHLDVTNNLVYFHGQGGFFGFYNITSNTSTDLRATDTNNWMGTANIWGMSSDSYNNVAYLVGEGGLFGIYNATTNTTEALNETDTDDWIGTNILYGIAFDSTNNLTYIGGEKGIFGYYNRTSNATLIVAEEAADTGTEEDGASLPAPIIPTQTVSIGSVEAGGSVNVQITNPAIEVTNMIVTFRDGISSGRISITETDVKQDSDFIIGLPLGTEYQAFDISLLGFSNDNISSVIINFKVNKTWLAEQNSTIDDVNLLRQADEESKFTILNTTFIGEDTNSYYFSAFSPGFSTFAIFVVLKECTSESLRCLDKNVQLCYNYRWFTQEECEFGCVEGRCSQAPPENREKIIIYIGITVIGAGIIIGLYFMLKSLPKKKHPGSINQ